MARLRWWHSAFFAWLFALYNTERLHEPINLASFVYVVAAGLALLIILVPAIQRISLPWLLLPVGALVIVPKMLLGQSIAGAALPLTVTELVAVGLTTVLARQLSACLEEYRTAAVTALVSHFQDRSRPFDSGQKEIYREVRRARACHRPLALLVVKTPDRSPAEATDRVTRELQ